MSKKKSDPETVTKETGGTRAETGIYNLTVPLTKVQYENLMAYAFDADVPIEKYVAVCALEYIGHEEIKFDEDTINLIKGKIRSGEYKNFSDVIIDAVKIQMGQEVNTIRIKIPKRAREIVDDLIKAEYFDDFNAFFSAYIFEVAVKYAETSREIKELYRKCKKFL